MALCVHQYDEHITKVSNNLNQLLYNNSSMSHLRIFNDFFYSEIYKRVESSID